MGVAVFYCHLVCGGIGDGGNTHSSPSCGPQHVERLLFTRYTFFIDAAKQGACLALLRMAGEMQACLPSSRFPLTRDQAPNNVKRSEDGSNSNSNSRDVLLATRDSSLDVVQRQYLRVVAAAFLLKRHLFRYQGTVSAALVLGGVDAIGEHLYQVSISSASAAVI